MSYIYRCYAVLAICFFLTATSVRGQSPNAPQSADEMFAQLDANGDGKLTLGEGGPGSQQFLRRLFEMTRKQEGDSISREEMRRIVDEHRRGMNSGNRPNNPRPDNSNSGPSNSSQSNSSPPNPGQPNSGRANPAAAGRRSNSSNRTDRPTASNAALQNRLSGTWRGWVVEGRGENPNSGQMQMELRVEGNRIVGREVGTNRAPQGLGDGTFVIAGDGNSGTLDAVSTSGQHSGRSYAGIFQLDGDTLRWCVNNRNGERPAEFETGRGNYFMVLHKQR